MSKFCSNCGTQLDDLAAVCPSCGAKQAVPGANPVDKVKQFVNNAPVDIEKVKKNRIPIIIGAAAVLLVIILIVAISGSGPKAAAKKYLNAVKNLNAKKVYNMLPEEEQEEDRDDREEDIEDLEENFEMMDELFEDEYGKNYRISYKIGDMEEYEEGDDEFDHYDDRYDDVKRVVSFEVELSIKGSEDEDEDETTIWLIKQDGSWRVVGGGIF